MVVKGSEGRHNRKRFYVASIISAVVFLTLIVFVAGLLFQDRQQDDGQKDLGGRSASKFLGGAVDGKDSVKAADSFEGAFRGATSSLRRTALSESRNKAFQVNVRGNRSLSSNIIEAFLDLPLDEDPEKIEALIHNKVMQLYKSLGFVKAHVTELWIEPGNPPTVDLEIEEGNLYHFKEVSFKGFENLDNEKVRSAFPKSEDLFDSSAVKDAYSRFESTYKNQGYLDARVVPTIYDDASTSELDIQHEMVHGPRYFVGSISAPPGYDVPLNVGDPVNSGLLQAYLESRNLSDEHLTVRQYPDSSSVDIIISP